MRKRIALFANGWGSEYLQQVGNGVRKYAGQTDVDVFAFINHSAFAESTEENNAEMAIFHLPDLRDFSGAILLTNSFNSWTEADYLQKVISKIGIPAVSLECEMEGAAYLGTDNYSGMRELAEHLFHVHNVRRILFIGGPREHAESAERLKAVLDTAAENGITVPKENILYGDWSSASAEQALTNWLRNNDIIPDVVICANDLMAAAACLMLKNEGYRVPEDVIVTGFDCIRVGRENTPSITSVRRDWEKMGQKALELLLEMEPGSCTLPYQKVKSYLVCGESCGCDGEEARRADADFYGNLTGYQWMDGFSSDRHFRHLYKYTRKVDNEIELQESLYRFYESEGWMEGTDFMLCLHPEYFNVNTENELFRKMDYEEKMNVICGMNHSAGNGPAARREVMFRAADKSDKPGTYLFVPLHSDDLNLGFAMLSRDFDIAMNNLLYIWTRHMNQYLEQVRSNIKVAEMAKMLSHYSVTDALTETYNRTGCEKIIYPFLEKCQREGDGAVLLIADIDCMKNINDNYGHAQGDYALQIVAEVLKTRLPEGCLVGRFGGDEFLVGGKSGGNKAVEEMIAAVTRGLAAESKKRELPYTLTLSMGGLQLKPGDVFNLAESIQCADDNMYHMKQIHHRNK